MTIVGEVAQWIALFLAIWSVAAYAVGVTWRRSELVESGQRGVAACALMTALAVAGVVTAFVSHDFSLQYVAAHSTRNTPLYYLVTALWAGPPGVTLSLAAFVTTLGLVTTRSVTAERDRAWVGIPFAVVTSLLLVAVCFVTNPYDGSDWVPSEGRGLDATLQHGVVAPYYVALQAAIAAALVPFALGVAATATPSGVPWARLAGRGAVATFVLLSMAIGLRMRWLYLETSIDAWWTAELAQSTTLISWALAFGLLVAVGVSRSPEANKLTVGLAFGMFAALLATAAGIPRPPSPQAGSGVTVWAAASLAAFAVMTALAIALVVRRLPRGMLASDGARNLSLALVLAGVALVGAGVVARASWVTHTVSLRSGEAIELPDRGGRQWRFVSQGISRDEARHYLLTGVALEVFQGGTSVGLLSADRRQYLDSSQRPTSTPVERPGILSALTGDVYVILREIRDETAEIRISFRRWVPLVWIGWTIVLAGGLAFAAVVSRRRSGLTPNTAR